MKNKLIITVVLGILFTVNLINNKVIHADGRVVIMAESIDARGVGTYKYERVTDGYYVLGGKPILVNTTTDYGDFYSNGTTVTKATCYQKKKSIYPGVIEFKGCTTKKSGNNYIVSSKYKLGYKIEYASEMLDVERLYTLYPSGYFYTAK